MDHLPTVANPHRPIVVPYYGYPYEHHGFSDFPVPPGVSLAALEDGTAPLETVKHAAPYLQARFCFGLISEMLGMPVDRSDFIKTENGRQLITTAKLPDYLKAWRAARDATGTQDQDRFSTTRIGDLLDLSYETWQSIPQFTNIVGPEVELSIQLIARALDHAVSCVTGVEVGRMSWRRVLSEFVHSRMVEDGWCPSFTSQLGSSKLTWQYFASLTGPPSTIKDHSGCSRHGRCLVEQQRATDQDNASQHVCDNKESCPEIKAVDNEIIANIVRVGGIPLLEYRDGVLHVSEYTKTSQYTAISHIWTDGLGNPNSNSMPHCQLNRLNTSMKMIPWTNICYAECLFEDKVWITKGETVNLTPDQAVAKAERPLLFWIDTICVPRDVKLKMMAVDNMRAIYNRANRVLVFDAGFAHVKGQLSSEEVLTRISLSNWLRRFWTLQEAVLAKVLWFRFGDECYRQMADSPDTWLNEVQYYCEDFDFNWRQYGVACGDSLSYPLKVFRVWSELKRREASYLEDQPVCIATLLDMDIGSIQQPVGYDARFRKLWTSYKVVPKRLLFLLGPRLTDPCLRWAPAYIQDLEYLPCPPGLDEEAKPTLAGLEVKHHGIISQGMITNSGHGFIPMQIGEDVYLVRENVKRENLSWKGLDLGAFEKLAVLLQQNEMQENAVMEPFEWALGALVGLRSVGSEGAVIECEYLRTVSVLRRGSNFEKQYRKASPLSVGSDVEDSLIVAAQWSQPTQHWLIT